MPAAAVDLTDLTEDDAPAAAAAASTGTARGGDVIDLLDSSDSDSEENQADSPRSFLDLFLQRQAALRGSGHPEKDLESDLPQLAGQQPAGGLTKHPRRLEASLTSAEIR